MLSMSGFGPAMSDQQLRALEAAAQLGLAAAVLDCQGRLLRGNSHFESLVAARHEPGSSSWLAAFDPTARAPLLAALAGRDTGTDALALWVSPPARQRWLQASLSWPAGPGHPGQPGDPAAACVALFHEVTALKHSEIKARQTQDKLCLLADAAPVMMAFFEGPRQICSYTNQAFAQALCPAGRCPLGRPLSDALHPALVEQLQPVVMLTLESGRPVTVEQPLRVADGSDLWVEVTLAPYPDGQAGLHGVYMLVVDQSRHHHAERALLESEERLSRFMQASVEGIFFHHDGHIADANPALCELVGRSLHDLLGRPTLTLIAPEHQARTAARMNKYDTTTIETSVVHQDGTRIPVELIERSTMQNGEPMRMTVVRDVRDRHATQARLNYLVHHDALTGLPNRPAFLAQLDHLMVAARASDTQLALLFIDLDHFKRVNDSVGHTTGDALLKTISQRISERVRSTDRVARFGGDEFMVLLPGVRDREAVVNVAHKLVNSIAAPVTVEGQPISVTPSLGIAMYPQDGDTPDVLIKHADAAMHVAKARGRATYAFFEQAVVTSAYDNLVLEGQLGHAIEHEEFALLFQPQVDTRDGVVVGVEALIRWHHPLRGLLVPNEFIALAEQHRLIVPIGAWVLREAARQAQVWHGAGWPLTVAVNLSTLQFQAPGFVESIETLLAETALPTGWLELELTERMLMDDVPQVRARLARLKALGVKLSVDDFGTGYSSLSHLRELPIDKMKIDRSFVQDLPQQRESAAIALAIIHLAGGLGLTVVAEGVENEAQQHFLVQHGCDQLQGMGISPPLTVPQFQDWMRGRRLARG